MKKKLYSQRGAAMLEAAYVLPLMMVMVLMLVDVITYASDRLYANDVMADAYHLIMGEASAVTATDPVKTNVQCNLGTNQVELITANAEATIKDAFVSIFTGLSPGDITISTNSSTAVVPEVHIVNVSFPSQTIFLPAAFSQSFPVKAKLILSFDLGC